MTIRYLFFISMFFVVDCAAYFYHLEEVTNGQHKIFLLRDLHGLAGYYPSEPEYVEKKRDCNQQRIDLLNIAQKLEAHIVVEDVLFGASGFEYSSLASLSTKLSDVFFSDPLNFDPNVDYSVYAPTVQDLPNDKYCNTLSPLWFLTQFCYQYSVHVDNVESRFVNPVMYPAHIVLALYNKNIAEIKAFNDDHECNAIYEDVLTQLIEPDLKTIAKLSDHQLGICLELKILHHINSSKCSNIFVCAGGAHIQRVRQYLFRLGYSSVREDGNTTAQTSNYISPAVNLQSYFG